MHRVVYLTTDAMPSEKHDFGKLKLCLLLHFARA